MGLMAAEIEQLGLLALSSAPAGLLDLSIDAVNLIILGRLGKGNLAAGAAAQALLKLVDALLDGLCAAQVFRSTCSEAPSQVRRKGVPVRRAAEASNSSGSEFKSANRAQRRAERRVVGGALPL